MYFPGKSCFFHMEISGIYDTNEGLLGQVHFVFKKMGIVYGHATLNEPNPI